MGAGPSRTEYVIRDSPGVQRLDKALALVSNEMTHLKHVGSELSSQILELSEQYRDFSQEFSQKAQRVALQLEYLQHQQESGIQLVHYILNESARQQTQLDDHRAAIAAVQQRQETQSLAMVAFGVLLLSAILVIIWLLRKLLKYRAYRRLCRKVFIKPSPRYKAEADPGPAAPEAPASRKIMRDGVLTKTRPMQCKVCHEDYTEPTVLPCGHVFCKACISQKTCCVTCGREVTGKEKVPLRL